MARDDLIRRAEQLGVPVNSGVYKPSRDAWNEIEISDYQLHQRIRDEQRHRREHRLWIVAVVSAAVAVLSAVPGCQFLSKPVNEECPCSNSQTVHQLAPHRIALFVCSAQRQ
jgi:hypothetical protein